MSTAASSGSTHRSDTTRQGAGDFEPIAVRGRRAGLRVQFTVRPVKFHELLQVESRARRLMSGAVKPQRTAAAIHSSSPPLYDVALRILVTRLASASRARVLWQRRQFMFGLQPILERAAVLCAPRSVEFVRATFDFFAIRLLLQAAPPNLRLHVNRLSLKWRMSASSSRMIRSVQRSARSSLARATGQYWP